MSGSLLLAAVLVLRGATVHTAEGPAIPNGVVVIEDGKITAVGGPGTPVPDGAEVLELPGRHVAPAFFTPASNIGLSEIQAVRATNDVTEIGEINPEVRPEVAANLDSEAIPVTRSNGVLFAALVPRGSVLPGAASVLTLEGWTREDSCVKCPAALVVEWPEMMIDRSPDARPSAKAQEKRRDDALKTIREAFRSAAAWRKAKAAAGQPGVPAHDDVLPMAALVPALEGKVPLLVHADKKSQIEAALRFVDEELKGEKVRVVLLGGHDAPRLADVLAERKIPVVVDGTLRLPFRTDEAYDAPYALPGVLAKAGVLVAVTDGSRSAAQVRDLPNHAAMAAAYGLDPLEALRAVTLNPARIYGVEDRIGSIAAGKEASIAVWTGDPLQITSVLVGLYQRGESLDLSDRHKRLWERYRNRPKPAVSSPAAAAPAPPAAAPRPPG
ncbi:MAG TPA: amidohydrolase family protein [Thermoanaerobaculia bacterium]|nr:amidohydrolase family protein [Thermoanaerobaculia bacterium]